MGKQKRLTTAGSKKMLDSADKGQTTRYPSPFVFEFDSSFLTLSKNSMPLPGNSIGEIPYYSIKSLRININLNAQVYPLEN
jgi:hypothetical protein